VPGRAISVPGIVLATCSIALAQGPDWSGYASIEPRVFMDAPLFAEQAGDRVSWSAVLAPEFRYEWSEGRDRLTVAPYLRFDQHDQERAHFDLREAAWLHTNGPWTLLLGVSRVFWGVAESRHLVDIINQTDQVDDVDGEDKLGQPMIRMERRTDFGTFGVFVLPVFRERTFPADDGRLRAPLPIAVDRPEYDRRVDLAVRWARPLGPWDLGLSAFHGISREPRLVPTSLRPTEMTLIPYYDLITQLGADVQYTRDAWLWKLELIERSGRGEDFVAAVAGFEYTVYGPVRSALDLGVLVEYLYDGRNAQAPPTYYDDDVFVGLRLTLNDADGTALLAGAIFDRNGAETFGIIEAQRRIGQAWRLELEARLFSGIDTADPLLGGLRYDSVLTFRAARFF
jgi:hypothetical protein